MRWSCYRVEIKRKSRKLAYEYLNNEVVFILGFSLRAVLL